MLTRILAASAIFLSGAAAFAGRAGHGEHLARVAAYEPMQAFNQIVGETQFIGYFLAAEDACEVTVMVSVAGDERLTAEPRRIDLVIKAADRSEIAADEDRVLAIGCTVDADEIRVVDLSRSEARPARKPGA